MDVKAYLKAKVYLLWNLKPRNPLKLERLERIGKMQIRFTSRLNLCEEKLPEQTDDRQPTDCMFIVSYSKSVTFFIANEVNDLFPIVSIIIFYRL